MIKPATLYNFGKMVTDPVVAGHVLMALCKQDIALSPMEQVIVKMVAQDSEWMEERIEENKAKERERKRAYRKSTESTQCPEMSQGQNGTPQCPKDKTEKVSVPRNPDQSVRPSNPSNPSNPNIKHRSVTDTDMPSSGTGRGEKFELMMEWPASLVYGGGPKGDMTALDMYHAAFGPGWSRIHRQLGEGANERMLDELSAFISEWQAGENHHLKKPAAAVMTRLQKWLKAKGVNQ